MLKQLYVCFSFNLMVCLVGIRENREKIYIKSIYFLFSWRERKMKKEILKKKFKYFFIHEK